METRQCARAGGAVRHGHARVFSIVSRALLCLPLVCGLLTFPSITQASGQGVKAPPPPPQVSVGQGSVTVSNGVGGVSGSGPSWSSGGNPGSSTSGNPGDSGGGGGNYFTIVIPTGSDGNPNNTFDATYVQQCADQAVSTVSYQWSGGSNGTGGSGGSGDTGGGSAGGHGGGI